MIPNFYLLGKEFSPYMILALAGVLTTLFYTCHLAKQREVDDIHMLYLLLFAFGGAAVGGHILFAFTQPLTLVQFFKTLTSVSSLGDFITRIQAVFGGSVFYGGLLFALLIGWLYIRKHQLSTGMYADMGAVAIPLFHTFGRIGCFLSGCCYGIRWDYGFVYHHSPVEVANHTPRFPVQLVEAVLNLSLFLFLLWLLRSGKLKNRLLAVYLLIYPAYRFVLEYLRDDNYRGFLWGLSTSQWISLILIVFTTVFWCHAIIKGNKNRSSQL
jgi:phosphatidylglycerol:prolipoprotein diacylglycerol transferase